jgi:hypothetical protein
MIVNWPVAGQVIVGLESEPENDVIKVDDDAV